MTMTTPLLLRRALLGITVALALLAGACGSNATSEGAETAETADTTDQAGETDESIDTFFVSGTVEQCEGEGTFPCYPTNVGTPDGEETRIYEGEIEGFTHEAGHSYELRVRITDVEDPPADGSSLRYELVEIVSDTTD